MSPLEEVVLAALRNRYVRLSQVEREGLAREIVSAVLKQLHDTGALSVPPEDLTEFPMTDPKNATP